MKRSIQRLIEDPISDELIQERLGAGDKVEAYLEFDTEFPLEKTYAVGETVTEETKDSDKRQSLIKAKVLFKSTGKHTKEEQEVLKRSTIKSKKKVLTLGADKGSGASKEPAGNKTA